MKYILEEKEPSDVLHYFEDIAAIPHGSGNMEKISGYLVNFAKEHSLEYIQDECRNVIIFKGASKGYERAKTLILQGHMDMVAEKNAGVTKDMEKEGLTLILEEDGDTLRADGTTLGADDGVAVAMMLAILADDSLPHPPVECVFTTDEETSMGGANGLDCSPLKGRLLLNLDSEKEGTITAGCAGGSRVRILFPIAEENRRCKEGYSLTVKVSGLLGGHSGEAIGLRRLSAVKLLGRILSEVSKVTEFRLMEVGGGTKDNAIPREAQATVFVKDEESLKKAGKAIEELAESLKAAYVLTDPGLKIEALEGNKGEYSCLDRKLTNRIARFLTIFPQGVMEYTAVNRTAPETSLSLGILKQSEDEVFATFLVRSAINSEKTAVVDCLLAIAGSLKADAEVLGTYPAWEYRPDSEFRDTCAEVYTELTGKKSEIAIIHGGVECGLLSSKIPGLDAISIGPDTHEIHTPGEHIALTSIGRTYDYVKAILKKLK